jgi:putative aldouronate transport system permease protein
MKERDNITAEETQRAAEPFEEAAAEASFPSVGALSAEEAEKLRRKNYAAKSPFARIMKHKLLYLMLIPSLILVITFCYVPMFGVVIAFKDYNLYDGFAGSEWVGLKYFKYIFQGTDPNIFLVFRNTIYISLIRVATNFPAILIFALMINEIGSKKLKGITRTIAYLPSFISWIAVGGMMVALLSVEEGGLNAFLSLVQGKEVKINWYAQDQYWWAILALSSMWKSLGWGTIVYMSALGCINSELYDACKIDGGGRFRMILSVTIPGIMNVIMLQLIMDAGNLIRDNYEQILAMTNGSTALSETTYVVGAMSYSSIMSGSGYSQATAFSLVQGVIGLVLVLLTNKIAKKTDNEGVV